jgi:hypothetical protein
MEVETGELYLAKAIKCCIEAVISTSEYNILLSLFTQQIGVPLFIILLITLAFLGSTFLFCCFVIALLVVFHLDLI